MRLMYFLAAVQIGLAAALPAPDSSTVDMNPANNTETDMSRLIPCDKKTIKVCLSLPSRPSRPSLEMPWLTNSLRNTATKPALRGAPSPPPNAGVASPYVQQPNTIGTFIATTSWASASEKAKSAKRICKSAYMGRSRTAPRSIPNAFRRGRCVRASWTLFRRWAQASSYRKGLSLGRNVWFVGYFRTKSNPGKKAALPAQLGHRHDDLVLGESMTGIQAHVFVTACTPYISGSILEYFLAPCSSMP